MELLFAFDLDFLSKVFSQAVHEAFDCIVVIPLVVHIAHANHPFVEGLHTFDGEQWAKVNADSIFVLSFGLFLWVIASILCFLKRVSSLARRSSRSSPVLNLLASSRRIPSVHFN